jgi:hypothetical protein
MNLKHVQRTSNAVMIIIIAFLGLIVVQVLLFQKAQEANRLSFINRINYITQDIVKSVRKMPQLDVRLLDSSRENHENLKHHIKLIVDSTLAANAIQLKNEFGIYLHEMDTDSDKDTFISDDEDYDEDTGDYGHYVYHDKSDVYNDDDDGTDDIGD